MTISLVEIAIFATLFISLIALFRSIWDKRFNKIEQRFDNMDEKFDTIG